MAVETIHNYPQNNQNRISRGTTLLTESDAITVAQIFNNNPETKGGIRKHIKSVVPIFDDNNQLCCYAVNYDHGYTIISATTCYYPILADVDNGTFDGSPTRTGADLLISDLLSDINHSLNRNTGCMYSAWSTYLENNHPDINSTKTYVNPAFYDVLNPAYTEWINAGYDVYFIGQQPPGMPDDLYARFVEIASEESPYGYPYEETAKITVEHRTVINGNGPLLSTLWDQGYPYNYLLPNNMYLGCVTIATGQIMRYFEYPSSFNWNAMPNSTSAQNYTLSSFLTTLRSQLHVNNDGGSNITWAKNVLTDYGYSCSIINHANSYPYSSIVHNRPVYMRGFNTSSNEGHAWVCDGYQSWDCYTKYVLHKLYFDGNLPDRYEDEDQEEYYNENESFVVFHMNFGWGGSQNGYFLDSSVPQYNTDRKDIIISGHN